MNSLKIIVLAFLGLCFLGKGLYTATLESDWVGSFLWLSVGILLLIEYRERKQK
jgi:hypothetical protein